MSTPGEPEDLRDPNIPAEVAADIARIVPLVGAGGQGVEAEFAAASPRSDEPFEREPELPPRELDVSVLNHSASTVKVMFGTVLGDAPPGFSAVSRWGFLTVTVSNGDEIYAKAVVASNGSVSGREILAAASTPANNPATGLYHWKLADITIAGGKISVEQTRWGPIEFALTNCGPAGAADARLVHNPGVWPNQGCAIRQLYSTDKTRLTIVENGEQVDFTIILSGLTGSRGSRGSTGSRGSRGSTGTPGPMGSRGWTGSRGSRGSTGTRGSTGPKGSTGPRGSTGRTGSRGPRGSRGSRGSKGADGTTPDCTSACETTCASACGDLLCLPAAPAELSLLFHDGVNASWRTWDDTVDAIKDALVANGHCT